MLKFSRFVYHYGQPPDAKVLFNHFVRRGREFLEKVRNGGRHASDVVSSVSPPSVVCSQSRAVVCWQKSSAAWKNIVNSYLTRNHNHGFTARYARSYRPAWLFGAQCERHSYRGLARKVAMYGFVGVAVSSSGTAQQCGFNHDDFYSTLREMFAAEAKHLLADESEPSVNSVSDSMKPCHVISTDTNTHGDMYSDGVGQHKEQEADSIETALMHVVEVSNCQSHQLQQLIDTSQAHNATLRHLLTADAPSITDLNDVSSADVSDALPSIDWSSSDTDTLLGDIDNYIRGQHCQMTEIASSLERLNSQLREAFTLLTDSPAAPTTLMESDSLVTEITSHTDEMSDDDDDDDEGFVVILSSDELVDDVRCTGFVHLCHEDKSQSESESRCFPSMINIANGHATMTAAANESGVSASEKSFCTPLTVDDDKCDCTFKTGKLSLAEFLSSHSVDITQ